MDVAYRRTWRNHTGNQAVEPLRIYRPRRAEELVDIVREAEACDATVRAVGSGHSWSDVALTTGFLVDTHRLSRRLGTDDGTLRDGVQTATLSRAEAGMRLRELNASLWDDGLALSNMGGYDAQTIAGVMSTSTHGSGIAFGPIADAVRSLDLVAAGGRRLRIEPAGGPTDPARFAARRPGRTLVQDDHVFRAAVVGVGSLGIVHEVLLQVQPAFWLREVRTVREWEDVESELRDGAVLRRHRHYEVYVSPYAHRGRRRCLVTTRDETPEPVDRPRDKTTRHYLTELLSTIPLTPKAINLVTDVAPRSVPLLLDLALRGLRDDEYTNRSYRVLNIGAANLVPAYSAEIGLPMDGRHLDAVRVVADIAERHRRVGRAYHTAPIALRFVKASPAYLSMMHGRDTMMMELIQMTDTEGGFELLGAYEDALYALGGRPHWGQVNTLTGSGDLARSMYPRWDDWLDVHAQLNDTGVFDSPFCKRVGISRRSFAG
jgi:L-gulono-1,4-lactone dehydrogenase